MLRIRQIKPEFWGDTRLRPRAALVRLTYLCLWSMADDEGRLEGDADTVWRFGFAHESSREIRKALEMLAAMGRIAIYAVNGNPYIAVHRFGKHQRPSHKLPSKLPVPPEVSGELQKSPENSGELCQEVEVGVEVGVGTSPGVPGEESASPRAADPPPFQGILKAWNGVAQKAGLPEAEELTRPRQVAVRARWQSPLWRSRWQEALGKVPGSGFLKGDNDRGWRANLDWFLRPGTVAKLLEGAYHGKPSGQGAFDEALAKIEAEEARLSQGART